MGEREGLVIRFPVYDQYIIEANVGQILMLLRNPFILPRKD